MAILETYPILAFNFGPMEMMVLGFIVLLLFGNRLPSVMRSLGVGITEFKKGINSDGVDDQPSKIADRRNDAT